MISVHVLSRFVGNVLGNLYPAYMSYKAVRGLHASQQRPPPEVPSAAGGLGAGSNDLASGGATDRSAVVKVLLMYWIVNTAFTLFELFGDVLVSWLPLYYEAKIAFLVWLTIPDFKGTRVVYKTLVAPYLERYEPQIDEFVAVTANRAGGVVHHLKTRSVEYVSQRSGELLMMGSQILSKSGDSRSSVASGDPVPLTSNESKED